MDAGMVDARLTSNLLLVGAALALIGNVLHPIFPGDVTAAEVIAESESALWVPIHLGIAIAIVLLTVALVQVARRFRGTDGGPLAGVGATVAVIGGAIFTVQIGALDGYALPALAAAGMGGSEAAVALFALDGGMLALVILLYFGATFLAFGLAMRRSALFAVWIRWTAIVAGSLGLVAGVLMLVDVAAGAAMIGFRFVALAATAVAVGLGLELRRSTVTATEPAPMPA